MIPPGTNAPAVINGINYSGHAIDRMQGSGIVPSVVENTLQTGLTSAGRQGATVFYDAWNDVTVVLSNVGKVITVHYGR